MIGDYLDNKNRHGFRRWLYRRATPVVQPDVRDQELRDRGAVLEWRQRVARNLRKKENATRNDNRASKSRD